MIGYTVAVRKSQWPTMQTLQACIDRHGWPVKLGDESHPDWTNPFETVRSTFGVPVIFKGEPIELEAELHVLEPDHTVAFNQRVASFNAPPPSFEAGDRILGVIFRADLKEYQGRLLSIVCIDQVLRRIWLVRPLYAWHAGRCRLADSGGRRRG